MYIIMSIEDEVADAEMRAYKRSEGYGLFR